MSLRDRVRRFWHWPLGSPTAGVPVGVLAHPPTEAELAWWAEARRPERRRIWLLMALPWGAVAMLQPLLRDPAAWLAGGWLRALVAGLVAGTVMGYGMWWAQERVIFPSRLAGKRVRDALLAGDGLEDGVAVPPPVTPSAAAPPR